LEILIDLKYTIDSLSDNITNTLNEDATLFNDKIGYCEQLVGKLTAIQLKVTNEKDLLMEKGAWNFINHALREEIEQVSDTAIKYEKAMYDLKEMVIIQTDL
jgi:hypothetical protein